MDARSDHIHRLAVLALPGVVASDLSLPVDLFRSVRVDGRAAYEVWVAGPGRVIASGVFEVRPTHGLASLAQADTVIVPGIEDLDAPVSADALEALQQVAARGARIAGVCSGAFVLAAAGLLDGRRATTHWLAAEVLAKRYPRARVEPDRLFVDEGSILTSAGASAAIDLCLHIIRSDLGATVAALVARLAVAPLERPAQHVQRTAQPRREPTLEPVLRWIESSLDQPIAQTSIARRARMSARTLTRRFRAETGMTPSQWVALARVRRAQELLEGSDLSIDQIAARCGLASTSSLRAQFHAWVGASPTAWRARHASGEMAGRRRSLAG